MVLALRDFLHLPELEAFVGEISRTRAGLTVVAGLNPRAAYAPPGARGFLPSGRMTFFRILLESILRANAPARCIAVTDNRDFIRVPREMWRRIEIALVQPPLTYADRIAEAARRGVGLLVVDRLSAETVPVALATAQKGVRVLAQLDTVFRGTGVIQHLLDLGAQPEQLGGLAWVLSVQRLPALCPNCKQPAELSPRQLEQLHRYYPALNESESTISQAQPVAELGGVFYRPGSCGQCHSTGRQGEVAVFDVYRHQPGQDGEIGAVGGSATTSSFPMEAYILRLAAQGHLAIDDLLHFEVNQLHHTFNLLAAQEQDLAKSNQTVDLKLTELEAANRVLQQRTGALISLYDLGQALIGSTSLIELAGRVCQRVGDLCGADRAILYFLRGEDQVEVLAANGWEPERLPRPLRAAEVFMPRTANEPVVYNRWPPGIPPRHPDVEGAALRAGLYVPLLAQERPVGVMIVHSTRKPSFAPGEVALLQTFANQAALAIQRAGLIDELRAKISLLEAAQAELARRERMEREMELARQVQQSMLPRTFPNVPGFRFAAANEPARQVGGDFYDVIVLDDQHFGVAIGDVSDKGLPAALYMALTRSLLRAEARRDRSPRAVVTNVNHLLYELGEPGMFVTIFYGIIEQTTRRLTFVRAGHDRPFLLHAGTIEQLGGGGSALGLLREEEFILDDEQTILAPGDRLVLYTDGLIDVVNPAGELYDRRRLEMLLRSNAHQPSEELCKAIFKALAQFQGSAEQFDDMTMLVLEVE
jgi:sigma-B regulation protein RsbU (phosphoserine phosphatase)